MKKGKKDVAPLGSRRLEDFQPPRKFIHVSFIPQGRQPDEVRANEFVQVLVMMGASVTLLVLFTLLAVNDSRVRQEPNISLADWTWFRRPLVGFTSTSGTPVGELDLAIPAIPRLIPLKV
jgi:hypothetical protein